MWYWFCGWNFWGLWLFFWLFLLGLFWFEVGIWRSRWWFLVVLLWGCCLLVVVWVFRRSWYWLICWWCWWIVCYLLFWVGGCGLCYWCLSGWLGDRCWIMLGYWWWWLCWCCGVWCWCWWCLFFVFDFDSCLRCWGFFVEWSCGWLYCCVGLVWCVVVWRWCLYK